WVHERSQLFSLSVEPCTSAKGRPVLGSMPERGAAHCAAKLAAGANAPAVQPLALAAPPPPPPPPLPPPPPHADRAASTASRSRRFNSLLIPPRIHPVIATPWLRIAESQSQLTRSGHGPHHR